MKYWTIAFPGEFGQHVKETWNEEQIIESYYSYWTQKMIIAGKGAEVSRENCTAARIDKRDDGKWKKCGARPRFELWWER